MLLQRPVLLLLLLSVLGTVMASKQKGGIGTKLGAKRTEVEALKGNLKAKLFSKVSRLVGKKGNKKSKNKKKPSKTPAAAATVPQQERPRCETVFDDVSVESCRTEYQDECAEDTVNTCITHQVRECLTSLRPLCSLEDEERCSESPVPECQTVKQNHCTTETKCTVETERVCSDDGVKTVCKTRADGSEVCLEEEEHRSCIDVDKQVCSEVPSCRDVPVRRCSLVPRRSCRVVPARRCRAEPREECREVPREHCEDVKRTTCSPSPRKVCSVDAVRKPRTVCSGPERVTVEAHQKW